MAKPFKVNTQRIITGDKEIDALLQRLKVGAANRIARPAVTKAARHLLKALKLGMSQGQYKNISHALGMRVDMKGGTSRKEPRAKVGAAVAKASKAVARRSGRNGNKGVGIGGRNIHWFLLGTDHRWNWRTTGRYVGRMPVMLPGLVKNTTAHEETTMTNIMRKEAQAGIEKFIASKLG